jgi:hypothetical protein
MSANNPFSTASVKMRRTRIEHMSAGLPPITDVTRRDGDQMALLGESIGVASEGIKETVSN